MDYQRITDIAAVSTLASADSIYIRQGDKFRRVSIADFLTALNIKDGVSPTVTIATIPGGHRLTITDADGPKRFDVMDGDTSDFIIFGGICSTAANVQTKVVQSGETGVAPGATLYANFAYANTAANPTLSTGGATAPIVGPDLQPIETAALSAGLHQLHLLAYLDATGSATTVWALLDKAGRDGQDGAPGPTGATGPQGPAGYANIPIYSCSSSASLATKNISGDDPLPTTPGAIFAVNFFHANTADASALTLQKDAQSYRITLPLMAQTLQAHHLTAGTHFFMVQNESWVALLNPYINTEALVAAVEEGLA